MGLAIYKNKIDNIKFQVKCPECGKKIELYLEYGDDE